MDKKKTTICQVKMSDGTSRVLMSGDHPNVYTIDPDDLPGGWTTMNPGKGWSDFINIFSLGPDRVQGIHFQADKLVLFALDLLDSWAVDSNQTTVHPDFAERAGYAFAMIPKSAVNCD